jgi:molybdopterin converting factor small subunit
VSIIRIPPVLRDDVGGNRTVEVGGRTVAEAIEDLLARHPSLRERITEDGKLSPFINVYVNERDVRYHDGLATPVGAADTIILLPGMAGGTA